MNESITVTNEECKRIKKDIFGLDMPRICDINRNTTVIQLSRRGPMFSKILVNGQELPYVTSVKIKSDIEANLFEAEISLLAPKIEVID